MINPLTQLNFKFHSTIHKLNIIIEFSHQPYITLKPQVVLKIEKLLTFIKNNLKSVTLFDAFKLQQKINHILKQFKLHLHVFCITLIVFTTQLKNLKLQITHKFQTSIFLFLNPQNRIKKNISKRFANFTSHFNFLHIDLDEKGFNYNLHLIHWIYSIPRYNSKNYYIKKLS